MADTEDAVASTEPGGAVVANHEGALEQIQSVGLHSLRATGWAQDRASRRPVQVQILVAGAVRKTVTADQPRPSGPANGFSATIDAPSQPSLVCARTVAELPRAGVRLGCKQVPFAVPIRVVTATGTPPKPPGQVASFFWVDARGDIAKDLVTVPIVNGAARYTGEPLPRALSWAVTVHDPSGRPLFRSGPLPTLPGSPGVASVRRINVYRSASSIAFGLASEEGGSHLLAQRLRQLPPPLRFDSMQLGADGAGHEVVVVRGRVSLVIVSSAFTYTLPVALRPATAPGRPNDVIVAERGGQGTMTGADVSRYRDVLDRAILDGVKSALDAAVKRIARLEQERRNIGFPATHVSATSIEVRAAGADPTAVVRVHGGTITDPGDIVVDG